MVTEAADGQRDSSLVKSKIRKLFQNIGQNDYASRYERNMGICCITEPDEK